MALQEEYDLEMWRRKRLIALYLLRKRMNSKKIKARKAYYIHDIFLKRKEQGFYCNLIQEMRLGIYIIFIISITSVPKNGVSFHEGNQRKIK